MKPLNPIMAVLVIASVGASPLRTLAADGTKTAGAVASAVENTNSINALTKILTENPDARKDAGKRVEEFLLESKGGKSFVAIDVNTTAAGAVAREWGEKLGPVGSVSMLYFVVGPGLVTPGWVGSDPLLKKTFVADGKWEPRLRIALADWTGKSQIAKAKEKSQVTAFLNDAAAKAAKVFSDSRDSGELEQSINQNNNTGTKVPDLSGGSRSRLGNGTMRDYTLKDLYEDGAVVTEVYGPGDANSRKISMKIYTKRLDDGRLVDEIGIFDITNTGDIFGQRFSLGDGDQTFVLDDRTDGHKKYELKFGRADENGSRSVTFARPDPDKKGGGVALTTTMADLYLKRADQAAALGEMGDIAKVGDQEFYVVPQGGALSGFVFLPKAAVDARRKEDIRSLSAGLFAVTGQRGADGWSQRIEAGPKGGPDLGKVNGKEYHLVWNSKLTPPAWEVTDGPGDPPPSKKPAGGDGTTPAPGGGTTPGGTTPGGTTPGGGNNKPELSIADLEKLLLLDATCRKYDEDTSLISADLKGKYGMIMCNPSGKPGGDQAILLVPKRVWDDQQMIFKSIKANDTPPNPTPAATLIRGRIVDHYVVLQFDTQVQYLDLLKKTDNGFELAGLVSGKDYGRDAGGPPTGEGDRPGMNNLNMFMDALRFYMGVPGNSEVFTEVPKRIKAEVGNTPLDLQAKYSNEKVLLVIAKGSKGEHFTIWPKVIRPSAPGSNQYAHLGGPANVFEPEVSSMNAPFEDKVDIANSYQLVRVGKAEKGEDIVLYKATDPTGKDKTEKYYLSFKYKGVDTANADPASAKVDKIFKQKHFEAFNDDNPLPGNRAMKGLTGQKDAIVRGQLVYRYISGTTKEKGVLAVFQNAAVSGEGQKDAKQNCIGPIVWWGLSNRAAALKVCKDDKF